MGSFFMIMMAVAPPHLVGNLRKSNIQKFSNVTKAVVRLCLDPGGEGLVFAILGHQ